MVSPDVLERKCREIVARCAFLERHLPAAPAALAEDEVRLSACERQLNLFVEYVLDLCLLGLAEGGTPAEESGPGILRQAVRRGILPDDTGGDLERLAHARNRLVHAYETMLVEDIHRCCRDAIRLGPLLVEAARRWNRSP
jgi:uncharacterized protein YutE (UPF0331/DUF86 family)